MIVLYYNKNYLNFRTLHMNTLFLLLFGIYPIPAAVNKIADLINNSK